MSVTQNEWSPGEHIIDIAIIVYISQPGAGTVVNKERHASYGTEGADRAVDTSR
jgi:hypothetical protein